MFPPYLYIYIKITTLVKNKLYLITNISVSIIVWFGSLQPSQLNIPIGINL